MDIINARINNPSLDEIVRRGQLNPLKWIVRRELVGQLYGRSNIDMAGTSYAKSKFHKDLYNSFGHSSTWNNPCGNPYEYGAVFNFDFSPDGSTLVAASERRSILMFDPLTHRMHHAKTDAHQDCVNVVKYIDNRLFATCSDDRTIKIWDQRKMDKELQLLSGHSNWVKNIECIDGKLLTSGFDGNIIIWDYDTYTESGEVPHRVLFQTRNLMRTALSPDRSKLVMSTSSGYIMAIHNLNISTLAEDLNGFKPNIYRLMQMNPTAGQNTIAFNHLFQETRTSNRLELIADFTDNVDVEIIASLKMHPSGNFIVSRNTSSDEQHEHTCVHDLRDPKERNMHRQDTEQTQTPPSHTAATTAASPQYLLSLTVNGNDNNAPIDLTTHASRESRRRQQDDRSRSRSRSPLRESATDRHSAPPSTSAAAVTNCSAIEGFRSLDSAQSEMLSRVLPSAQQRLDSLAASYASTNEQFMIFIQGGSDGVHQTLVLFADDRRNLRRPHSMRDSKLVYYVEEPNMGRGFIKEPCFSYDGRIICSPFAHGVRLLGYDSDCSELEEKVASPGHRKSELQEIASVYSHQNLVVATKYSPTHHLLVTGCLDGQVCFHQPLL